MNSIQTGSRDTGHILVADLRNRMGAGVRSYSLDLWEYPTNIIEDFNQVIRFDNHAVGVLQKDRPHTTPNPVQGSVQGHLFNFRLSRLQGK